MRLTKLYQNFFSRQNVGKQLMTLFICTILIPILMIGGIIYLYSYRQITQNYEHLSQSKATQVRSVLVSTTLYLNEICESISTDRYLWNLLACDYPDSAAATRALDQYDRFDQALANMTAISSLKLYVDENVLKQDTPYSYFYPVTDEVRHMDWYTRAASTKGNFWMSGLRTGQGDVQYWELNYYCHIPIPQTGSYAVLVMSVSNDYLHNLILSEDYDIYAAVNSDPVFFSTDRSYTGNSFPLPIQTDAAYYTQTGKMRILGEDAIASVQTMPACSSQDSINIVASSRDALSYIQKVKLSFLLAGIFSLSISGLLILLYTRYFSTRIQTLRLAMKKVAHNDYEIVNSIQGDDELTAVFSDLKTTVEKLKRNEAQIYETQIQQQMISNQQHQMELKLLANQINPHFLYNTLETIRMKAFAEGNREVATAIKLLGKSMRYVLNNTKTTATTLDKEIDYIKTYLAIQKMRFGERLNYTIRIDSHLDLTQYQILPLLIQPIIENAVSHGLEDTGKEGHVILKIFRSKDDLLIADVFDNGIGMSPEKLKDVIDHLDIPQPESDHGVGLYNINNRVHLFYGKSYGLSLHSRPGFGTLITLTIPLLNLTEDEP